MDRSLSKAFGRAPFIAVLSLSFSTACVGTIGGEEAQQHEAAPEPRGPEPGLKVPPPAGPFLPPERELAATVGLRRLSTNEYDATVRSLLGEQSRSSSHLLLDARGPFDSATQQEGQIGDSLIDSASRLANSIAAAFVNDQARRKQFIGCEPTSPGCLAEFVSRFGRLALRRPLSDEEKKIYLDIPVKAQRMGDPDKSAELIVSAFLQDPEFLHQMEIGTPVDGVPGLYKLSGYELASRLAYLIWGDMPSAQLLDQVAKGGLSTPDDVRAAARMMLADGRARGQISFFHQLWFGYDDITNSGHPLAEAMKNETNALIQKVVFDDDRPWQDLFRSDQTFVTFELAQNYGLKMLPSGFKAGSKATWVPYAGTPRRGILSQTSVLRWGSKFGDTSPVLRGKKIRERLFCRTIPKPDAKLKVNTDEPPRAVTNSLCKWDRYQPMVERAECAGCHKKMNPIGFGLENFDALGRYRTEQYWTKDANGLPTPVARGTAGAERCVIRNDGVMDDKPFKSPTELADLLVEGGSMTDCALQQLYLFGTEVGQLGDGDRKVIERFKTYLGQNDFNLEDILIKFVSSPAFAHRRMDLVN